MLVPTMNDKEIRAEIFNDHEKLHQSTIPRLNTEYQKERRKLKIAKERTYLRHYSVKTASKNNWIIYIGKAPSAEKYNNTNDLIYFSIVYYYGKDGLTVFKPLADSKVLVEYYGHLFSRYNERLELNLSEPIEMIQHFFTYNGASDHTAVDKDGACYSIGICQEGLLLGIVKEDGRWLVNKTFISKDLFRPDQDESEREMIALLEK